MRPTPPSNGGTAENVGYVPPPRPTPDECREKWDSMLRCWEYVPQSDDEEDPESKPAIPEITMTDLATFSPAPGSLVGEPDNLGVAGLPSNFVTDAAMHTRSGSLFGFPIQVRFTPREYTFHYGDGRSQTTPTAGESWSDLAQAQFTPTATSHTYAERGTYDARVDISYTAEIDLGVGWFPIDGELTIEGAAQSIRIYEAKTALVARTCQEQPTSAGC